MFNPWKIAMLWEFSSSIDFRVEFILLSHSLSEPETFLQNISFCSCIPCFTITVACESAFGFYEGACDSTVSTSIIHISYGIAGTCLGCQTVLACSCFWRRVHTRSSGDVFQAHKFKTAHLMFISNRTRCPKFVYVQ